MRRMIDCKCEACGAVTKDLLSDPKTIPTCTACGGVQFEVKWTEASSHGVTTSQAVVIGDDIPGGIVINHGICEENGDPKKYYTKSDIRKAAKAKGFIWGGDYHDHVTNPKEGTDKNPHTTRCVAMPGAVTAEAEAERVRAWHAHETQLQQELQNTQESV